MLNDGLNSSAARAFFRKSIEDTRRNFEDYRNSGGSFKTPELRCKLTLWERWFGPDRRFDQFYDDQLKIYKNGRIVWATIVQANSGLYSKGERDLPAEMLYSPSQELDDKPYVLRDAAGSLYDVKSKDTEPELQEFSRKLADEIEQNWKLTVPPSLSLGHQCYMMGNMLFRKHMPEGYLSGGIFPLLIWPEKTVVGFMVPGKFWSQDFIQKYWNASP